MPRPGAVFTCFCKFAHRIIGRLRLRGRPISPAKSPHEDDIRFAGLGLRSEEVISGGRLAFLCSLLAVLVFAVFNPHPVFVVVLVVLPLLVHRTVLSYPATLASRIERSSLREAPEVMCHLIGGAGEALTRESAVLSCAVNFRGLLKGGFERMVWNLYTNGSNIPREFTEYVRTWKGRNQGFEESLQCFSAAAGLGRLENPSSFVSPVHKHSRQKLKGYLASLKTPVNVVFVLGIALPVMIASVLPLSSLASAAPVDVLGHEPAKGSSVSPIAVAVILDVVFPTGMLLYCREVLSRRPLTNMPGYVLKLRDLHGIVVASMVVMAIGAAVMTGMIPVTPIGALVVLTLTTSVVSIALIITGRSRIPVPESRETISAAFECLGDLLQNGDSIEIALLKTAEKLDGTALASRILMDMFLVSRGDVSGGATLTSESAVEEYPLFGNNFKVIANIARRDGVLAGSIAKSIAADLRENLQMEADARIELKSVVQTVNSTLTYFSPIVLGTTAAMFLLIESNLVGSRSLTSSAFVIIVGALISCNLAVGGYFTQGLRGGDLRSVFSRIGEKLLVAVPVFAVSYLGASYLFGVL